MSTLTVISKALAFEDVGVTSNPGQRPINWEKTLTNIPVFNAGTRIFSIDPLDTVTLLDGSRTLSSNNSATYDLALSPLEPTRYRITNTALGGSFALFRTPRSLVANGTPLTFVVNANLTVTVSAPSGNPFNNTLVGDVVFIPGVSTGDAPGPFNTLNEGYWTVLSQSNLVITMARPAGTPVFSGIAETVTPSNDTSINSFSTAGVQVGDTLELSAGFSLTTRHAYEILAVNPFWLEILSTAGLGPQTGVVPTTAGLTVYKAAIRYLRLEADQECAVRCNGDTGNTNRLEPLIPGDKAHTAWREQLGPVWKLEIVNRSTATLNLTVLQAE